MNLDSGNIGAIILPIQLQQRRLYSDGCSYTAGCKNDTDWNKLWPEQMGYSHVTRNATVARSNQNMFKTFLKAYREGKITSDTDVIIQWSHSERTVANILKNSFEDQKNFGSNLRGGIIANHSQGLGRDGDLGETFTEFNAHATLVSNTFDYMYTVQELCKVVGARARFITVDHYIVFLMLDERGLIDITSIDANTVFNWPSELKMPDYLTNEFTSISTKILVRDKDESQANFMLFWGLQSFPLIFTRWNDIKEGVLYLEDDKKHFNEDGHVMLASLLERWLYDSQFTWQYVLKVESSINQQLVVEDILKGLEWLVSTYSEKEVHWVEKALKSFQEKVLKSQADFIYEK